MIIYKARKRDFVNDCMKGRISYAVKADFENILGKANYLSEKQIEPLLKTRENMGNRCGGEPLCSARETNDTDFMPQSGTVETYFTALDELTERIARRVVEKLKQME